MIELLCGPIASGKSTYAKNKAQEGYLIINDDAIVTCVHQDYTLYEKQLKPLYKSIENHILHFAVALDKHVIIDRGLNVNRQSRKRWISLAHSLDMDITAVCFSNVGPEVHARRRTEYDSRGHSYDYWLQVAQEHQRVYSEPSLDEGFVNVIRR